MSVPAATETFVGRAAELAVLRAAVERASFVRHHLCRASGTAGVEGRRYTPASDRVGRE